MLRFGKKVDKGDTLVEVLFATAVFSLVAVGGLAIMNQGTAAAQRALEITLVRQEIDAQGEALRFLNSSFAASYQSGVHSYPASTPAGQWQLMQDSVKITGNTSASVFGAGTSCPTPPQGSFIINAKKAVFIKPSDGKLQPAQTYSQVRYNDAGQVSAAEGIWVEAVSSPKSANQNESNAGYIDFHIRACWDSPGQSVPVTIGTIVRLYEPRG